MQGHTHIHTDTNMDANKAIPSSRSIAGDNNKINNNTNKNIYIYIYNNHNEYYTLAEH